LRQTGRCTAWRPYMAAAFGRPRTRAPLLPLRPVVGLPVRARPRRCGRLFVETIRPFLLGREWTPFLIVPKK